MNNIEYNNIMTVFRHLFPFPFHVNGLVNFLVIKTGYVHIIITGWRGNVFTDVQHISTKIFMNVSSRYTPGNERSGRNYKRRLETSFAFGIINYIDDDLKF